MVSLLYNILITSGYIFCAGNFLLLSFGNKKRLHRCFAFVFITFILDNLVLYMNDLLPEFAGIYNEMMAHTPYVGNLMTLLVCYAYRRTLLAFQEEEFSEKEAYFWFFLAFFQFIASLLYVYPLGRVVSFLIHAVYMGFLAYDALRKGQRVDCSKHGFSNRVYFAFVNIFCLNMGFVIVEFFLELVGLQILEGRFISIEFNGIYVFFMGIMYQFSLLLPKARKEILGEQEEPEKEESKRDIICEFAAAHDLTPREKDILELIYKGKTNLEIGEEMFIAAGTVKSHTHNIYGKLEVSNRVALIAKIREFK